MTILNLTTSLRLLLVSMAFMLCSATIFAQSTALKPIPALVKKYHDNQVVFTVVSDLFQTNDDASKKGPLSKTVQKSTLLTLNLDKLAIIAREAPAALTLTLPSENGLLTVDLVKTTALSEDFTVVTNQSANRPVAYKQGVYYRGIVKDDNNSLVAISLFEHEVFGVISNNEGNFVLGRLEEMGNKTSYIFYNDKDLLKKPTMDCATDDSKVELPQMSQPITAAAAVNGCVRVYLEADYALYNNKGSNTQNTVNFISAMYNNVAAIYQNEQVSTVVHQIYVWTTPDNYPTSNSYDPLVLFTSQRANTSGDLLHLFALGGNNVGGRAGGFNGLCSNNSAKYAYSNIYSYYNNVPTYSWTISVVAHEMGHCIGSPHTHFCGWTGGAIDNCGPSAGYPTEGGCAAGPAPTNGGTIMSYCHLTGYGINFNNGFGLQPGNLLRSRVSTAACLSASCTIPVTCPEPTNLYSSNVLFTSATLNWTAAANATAYILEYKTAAATTWTTLTVTGTTYNLTNLASSTTYNARVKTVCGTSSSTLYAYPATFTTLAICNPPTNLAASTILNTGFTINWTAPAGALSYIIQIKTTNSTTWSTLGTSSTNSYLITNLQAATAYNVRVQTVCSGDNTVAFSNIITVTTTNTTACGSTAPIVSYGFTTSNFQINLTAITGISYFQIEYKLATATAWTTVTTNALAYTIANLLPSTSYNVRIKAVCTSGISSPYWTATFTTLNGLICSIPTGLTAGSITTSSAIVSWNTVTGAAGYALDYATTVNPNSWSTAIPSGTSFTFYNLQPNTMYQLRIRTICTGNTLSAYSSMVYFTTLNNVGSGCSTPTGLGASSITGTTALIKWNTVGGAINYSLDYAATNNPNYWITATPNTNSFSLYNLQTNMPYQIRIKTVCGGGAASAYSSNVVFTTAAQFGGNNSGLAAAPSTTNTMTIAPNPVTDKFTIYFALKEESNIDLELTDVTGRTLHSEKLFLQNNPYEMNIQEFPKGIYFVRARINQSELLVKKVVK
jgi:Metallo-peptidase family M12/Secretion system C-terminal sorting domain/Fibronectin type III domain